ncbi:putative RNA-directed DNA polymerase [Helianthus annuus]|uniref:RNA-directed DNA polymerase n=1 Tax=Helianthus annuus TaxID=4232 RepID=A0A9K3GSY6_HELAN|nr:putative RNA-directed DNA polymerase [Helianthus annuus]KAJ0428477.1 putative RNA-directed DNA polymerase [Helianthus annuus]KAJ0432576.1 putative RNA-directed DNA polymerase [Helianthus annuus]KAJ0446817.1 putative RNA-directed DNA polymerase [Helianthus annuus]KAJ0631711.1 putative RNA-directed DNA polymerase [Helianthus annuus]
MVQPEPNASTSQTLIGKLDIGDPLYLHPSDSSALTIVSVKLKGTENYAVWSASMKLALEAKNKFGFINGKCEKSTEDSVLASQWDRCNSVVLTWLLNSVSEELFLGQVFSSLASEVWEDLKETYDKIDGSVVYDLFKKINSISQNGSTVADYYNRLTTMWKQFDAMLQLPTCSCKAAKDYNDFTMLIKLMQFLMGLDDVYQPVRTNLLTRETFPSVKVAYSVVSREESHRLTSNGSKGQNVSFVSKPNKSFESKKKTTNQRGPNPNLKCTHCNMIGHTIDRCFELIGYPPNFRKRSNNSSTKTSVTGRSNAAVGSSSSVSTSVLPFTPEQIAKLLSLVGDKSANVSSTGVESTNVGGESCFVSSGVSCSSSMFFEGITSWIVDSGASQHMVNSDKDMFNIIDVFDFDLKVGHPNGTNVKVLKIGDVKLIDGVILKDVFYVPGYHVNLLSVHRLAKDNNVNVVFKEDSCVLQDSKSRRILMTGSQDSGLYFVGKYGNSVNVCFNSFVKSGLWHSRLGHPSDQVLAVLKDKFGVKSVDHGLCDVCHRAKQVRVPFPLSEHKTKAIGELVHLDIWGPYKVTSYEGYKYFLTIVDDFSRTVWCYLLANKTEVFENLCSFYELVLTQFEKKIKMFRSDNGTEFVNNQMSVFCKNKGILHQTSCPYTPQQNGVVERKHRHLLNTARALMFQSSLPLRYWSDCILTAVYLINRLPSSVLGGKSPYEIVYGFKPSFDHLRNFGCLCFSTVLTESDKFTYHADKCVFVGYSNVKKGYKLLSLDNRKVFFSRDVKFYENVYPFKSNMNKDQELINKTSLNHINFFDFTETNMSEVPNVPNDEEGTTGAQDHCSDDQQPVSPSTSATAQSVEDVVPESGQLGSSSLGNIGRAEDTVVHDETNLSEGQSVRRSSRKVSFPNKFSDFVVEGKVKYGIEKVVNYANLSVDNMCLVTSLNKSVEPCSYNEAVKDSRWIEAMNNEMEALLRNNTWEVVDLPKGRKPIGCKWVYKIKYRANGEIERYKARLVAKGFNQREGIDFGETFSPVVKMVTVRIVLKLAVNNCWPLYQLDINNAFLYGSLSEEVYMSLLQGYYVNDKNKVCKLVKSLYGLKQAPRKWNEKLTSVIVNMGFVQSLCDHSLFILNKGDIVVILLVYVDDIVITGNNSSEIMTVKKCLSDNFQIKDLGLLKYFLGIEVLYSGSSVCLSQRKYCLELLSEFGYLGCKPVGTPIEQSHVITAKTDKDENFLENVSGFQKLIGKLIYLSLTRPDISYAVQFLSQYMHKPCQSHLDIALRLLRYLK